MTRRQNTSTGRGSPWQLLAIERDAERQPGFVDALRAAVVTATAYQHAAAEPLPEIAAAVDQVADRLADVAPFHWQRLTRLAGELREIGAELTREPPR